MTLGKYFIVDAETDGLDGPFLSIAAAVYDEGWELIEDYYAAIQKAKSNNPWVQENVLPHLRHAKKFCKNESCLLADFTKFWTKHRHKDLQIYADIPCPVESRLFSSCIKNNNMNPLEFPCPLYDLHSILLKADFNPEEGRKRRLKNFSYREHDASEDVRAAAHILKSLFPPVIPSETPISYHTFIFPFLFHSNKNNGVKEYLKQLDENFWIPDFGTELDNPSFVLDYGRVKYFHSAARNGIYTFEDSEENIVHNFRYKLPKDARYIIQVNSDVAYSLRVNALRLKIFRTGIGMLIYELENHTYREPDHICKINDYGRRVYAPFADSTGCCFSVASKLALEGEGLGEEYTSSPSMVFDPNSKDSKDPGRTELAKVIAVPLSKIRKKGCGEVQIINAGYVGDSSRKGFYIEPIIDDRMFTACFYHSDNLVSEMGKWDENQSEPHKGEYRYLRDALVKNPDDPGNFASLLYRLVFVDGSGSTCQSRTMLHDLLKKHIYNRWIEYKTITGISAYSMVSISDSPPDHIINAFLTQYIEMLILVLAQRASLLAFERGLSDASLKRDDIQKIQEEYTKFQSQLLLQEVTPQQQGIELYDMLRENMYIIKEQKDIEVQIRNLFDRDENKKASRLNDILFGLSLLAIFEAVNSITEWKDPSSLLADVYRWIATKLGCPCLLHPSAVRLILLIILLCIISIIPRIFGVKLSFLFGRCKRRRKSKNRKK